MTLTPSQLVALRNLSRKQAGNEVDWISIADARALTELGFAERSREGWNITASGESALVTYQGADQDGKGGTDASAEVSNMADHKVQPRDA